MSRTHKDARSYKPKGRHISVRAVRRNPPDLRKLSRALIELAMAEAAAEAAAQEIKAGPGDVTATTPPLTDEVLDD